MKSCLLCGVLCAAFFCGFQVAGYHSVEAACLLPHTLDPVDLPSHDWLERYDRDGSLRGIDMRTPVIVIEGVPPVGEDCRLGSGWASLWRILEFLRALLVKEPGR